MSKSIFISQEQIPTSTSRTLARIQWLMGHSSLEEPLRIAIKYVQDYPDRVEVTAVFLHHISSEVINELLELKYPGASVSDQRSKYLRQLKQELGIYVPIRLVALCGASNILTLRDGRAASPRKISWEFPNAIGATNYTPHKITPEGLEALINYHHSEPVVEEPLGLRGHIGFSRRYEEINREERNLAAILYTLLNQPKNLNLLFELIDHPQHALDALGTDEHAMFFEFAMLRDLWSVEISGNNERARQIILDELSGAPEHLKTCSVSDFNAFWGVSNPSKHTIQMPAQWSLSKMSSINDSELFSKACYFKWSFNAKPDLVIRTGRNQAICIEMKLESGVGRYPSSTADREVFKTRDLDSVKQTDVQKYLMEKLLGFSTTFVLLTPSTSSHAEGYRTLTWSELLNTLDLTHTPLYMRRTITALLNRI